MEEEMRDINDLIIKYLDGSATGPDEESLKAWLEESDANRSDFSQIRDLWILSSTTYGEDPATDKALARLMRRIRVRESGLRRNPFSLVLKVAAAAIVLLGVGYTCYQFGSRTPQAPIVMNRLITADGSTGRFMLPDSSVVWLNSNSTLDYPEQFEESCREVSLMGEAYFEVKHDESCPFIVKSGDIDVRVLGTNFLVENYKHLSTVEAILVEGNVEVSGRGMRKPRLLVPGEMLSYDRGSSSADVKFVNTDHYTSWIHNKVVFDNSTLGDISTNLRQWFVRDIYCDPKVAASVRLSFTLKRGDEIDEILSQISKVAPITYQWQDSTLSIIHR